MSHLSCTFNFYDEVIRIYSNSAALLDRLQMDFSFFLVKNSENFEYQITALLAPMNRSIIPKAVADRQSLQSLAYDLGEIRYNDYYGKLLSRYDYATERGELWSSDIEKLHEVTYLLILSRIGKALDMRGMHKVHAMSFSHGNYCITGMMPMKGGKSTLLAHLLKDPKISVISDDCPLVSRSGKIIAFPLRIGIDQLPKSIELIEPDKNRYKMQRDFYGEKNLIALTGLHHEIARVGAKQILFVGRRTNGLPPKLIKKSRLSMIKPIFINMIIGIGLPMVMEYFWQTGFKDFCRKSFIAISRSFSALSLILRSQCYEFQLSNNSNENAEYLLQYFKR